MGELTTLELGKLLKSFDKKIYFYPNPGNAGDSLIACATYQFFEKNNINYEVVLNAQFDASGKTIVYGGGGNFGGEQSRAGKFVKKYKDTAKHLVFLPHTIFGAEQLLASLGENCHLICREKISYEFVKVNASSAQVYLHPDIVFQSAPDLMLRNKPKVNLLPYLLTEIVHKFKGTSDYDFGLSSKGLLTYSCFKLKQNLGLTPKGTILKAFRVDVERTSDYVPPDNVDLSAVLELSSCQPDLAKLSCYTFLQEINKFDEIHTNRLHIAIGAALLGKQVKLYANNYYKIRAIYEYSMVDKFENVVWMQE